MTKGGTRIDIDIELGLGHLDLVFLISLLSFVLSLVSCDTLDFLVICDTLDLLVTCDWICNGIFLHIL